MYKVKGFAGKKARTNHADGIYKPIGRIKIIISSFIIHVKTFVQAIVLSDQENPQPEFYRDFSFFCLCRIILLQTIADSV